MKSQRFTRLLLVSVVALFMFASYAPVAAQHGHATRYPYTLIDLGTFGGPTSSISGPGVKILNDAGLICLCAFVAPHAAVREKARQVIGPDRFLEIYLSAPMEYCKQRDASGAYELADAGKLASFPGVSATFEPPVAPDLVLPTHEIQVEEGVERVLGLLRERGYLGQI